MGEGMKSLKGFIYGCYENLLTEEIKEGEIPGHIAVIMDGNRRFARKFGVKEYYGHFRGARTTENLLEWCYELGVKKLTIYAFSTENFHRTEEEKNYVLNLIGLKFDELARDERTHRRRLKVKILGSTELLPSHLLEAARRLEDVTAGYDGMFLNVALAYGGRQEIVDAARAIAAKVKNGVLEPEDVDEEVISQHLYDGGKSSLNVDLIIRTGGDERLSNFLPWQTNGNECAAYFCAPFWPELRKIDFLRAIRVYQHREYERKKNLVLRVFKLLSACCGQVEAEEIIKTSLRMINTPREEVARILRDLTRQNVIMNEMIRW